MFTDFVAECRADMLIRNVPVEDAGDDAGMETFESPRPVAVAA